MLWGSTDSDRRATSGMKRQRGPAKMATQIAATPTLSGKDAENFLKKAANPKVKTKKEIKRELELLLAQTSLLDFELKE